jgi:hypothetical protein
VFVGFLGQPRDFVGDVDLAGRGHPPQFLDLALEFGYRFFKIEVLAHEWRRLPHIKGLGTFGGCFCSVRSKNARSAGFISAPQADPLVNNSRLQTSGKSGCNRFA